MEKAPLNRNENAASWRKPIGKPHLKGRRLCIPRSAPRRSRQTAAGTPTGVPGRCGPTPGGHPTGALRAPAFWLARERRRGDPANLRPVRRRRTRTLQPEAGRARLLVS